MINDQYTLLVITGILIILHGVIEPFIHRAIWETQLIAMKSLKYGTEDRDELDSWNNAWHKWFAIMWAIIYASVILTTGEWMVILSGWFRLSLFPIILNKLKGVPIYYMSKDGIDKLITGVINAKAWMYIKIVLAVILIICILLKETTI